MLSVLAVQIGLGLFSVDEDEVEAGPLAKFIDFDTGRAIAHLHHKVFWVLVALICLHLLAILVYALRRRNLVGPMITGAAPLPPGAAPPGAGVARGGGSGGGAGVRRIRRPGPRPAATLTSGRPETTDAPVDDRRLRHRPVPG